MEQMIWFESLVAITNIHLILIYLLKIKVRKTIALILILILFIPSATLNFYFHNKNINLELVFCLICSLTCIIIPLSSYRGIGKKIIFYISFFYIGLSSGLISSVRWMALAFQASQETLVVIDIFINLLLFILVLLLCKNSKYNKISMYGFITKRMKILLMFCIWLSTFLSNFISALFLVYPNTPNLILIETMTALLIILLGIMCPLLITNNTLRMYYHNISSNMENQINTQVKHYELLVKANKDIRQFKHDFNNFKIGLKMLIADGDIEGALTYLDGSSFLESDYIRFETGNRIVDALLTEKNKIAQECNTKITFKGIIPPFLNAVDVCIILGNALDNAIEECFKIKNNMEKYINITSSTENRFLFIYMENPISTKVNIQNNHITTTKTNKKQHGIGLSSIRQAVEKYDGTVDISVNDGIFIIKIILDFNNI